MSKLLAEESEDFSKDEIQNLSMSLYKSASSTYNLLEDLLEWSQIQRGLTKPVLKKVGVKKLIDDVVFVHQEMMIKKSLELQVHINDDLFADLDIKMIQTVIRNLLTNAIKFTPVGGKVWIEAKKETEKIELVIADSGIGIPSSLLPKLFDVDGSKGRKGTEGERSSGLGLLICKEFIELNGGKIWVESIENKGSQFFIEIPC